MISVIMSVYNEKISYLIRSISSIMNQTYNNIELLIIDDNPRNVRVRNFLNNLDDSRIRIFFNNENLGQAKSRNIGLQNAKGDYIAIMDADDISKKNRFSSQLKFMKDNRLDFVYSNFSIIDENDKCISKRMWKLNNICSQNYLKKIIVTSFNPSLQSSWLMKKKVVDELHGYRNIVVEDLDFNLRSFKNKIMQGFQSDVLLSKRIRENGIMNSKIFESYFVSRYIVKAMKNKNIIPSIVMINNYYNHIYSLRKKDHFEKFVKSLYEFKDKKTLYLFLKTLYLMFFSLYSFIFLYELIIKRIIRIVIEMGVE